MPFRIIIADSSPLYRRGIAMILESFPEEIDLVEVDSYEALVAASTCQALVSLTGRIADLTNKTVSPTDKIPGLAHKQVDNPVDLIVMDDQLPGLSSLKQVSKLIDKPGLQVLITVNLATDQFVRDVFKAGCQGAVRKSVSIDVMGQALRVLLEGGNWHPARENKQWLPDEGLAQLMEAIPQLSQQEKVVLEWVRQGAMNKTIASSMQISENTVKSHVSRIFRKLRVENRTKLVLAVQSTQFESAALCRSL